MINDLTKEYDALKLEVAEFNNKLTARYDNKESNISKHYRGCQILYSQLIYKPDFLIIGLNPGAGFYNKYNEFPVGYEPLEELEYVKYNYKLGKHLKEAFKLANLTESFNKRTMKSNYFYFSTKGSKEFTSLYKYLNKTDQIHEKSKSWTKQLIQMTSPKVIICEGARTLSYIEKTLGLEKTNWKGKGVIKIAYKDFHIIAYKRTYSYMLHKNKNIPILVDYLKSLDIKS